MMRMKWLITGGCGFIGTNLVESLFEDGGHFVRVVDNLSVGTQEDLAQVCAFSEISPADIRPFGRDSTPRIVEQITSDILDAETAVKIAEGIDVIVHLAANTGVAPSVENPREDCITNVIGTLNYLEAARKQGVKRFVFASSGAPVGECEPPIHEEIATHPASPYGASKLAGEGYCSAYFRTFGLETVALRFGNVYGPGSKHKSSVVAKFIRQSLRGETLEVHGDGSQTRDFIYIDDLVQAIRLAAQAKDVGGELFQIATNRETAVGELVEKLLPILKSFGVKDVDIRYTKPRVGDVKRNFSDVTKAKNLLGWTAPTSLEKGLHLTALHFLGGGLRHSSRRREGPTDHITGNTTLEE